MVRKQNRCERRELEQGLRPVACFLTTVITLLGEL